MITLLFDKAHQKIIACRVHSLSRIVSFRIIITNIISSNAIWTIVINTYNLIAISVDGGTAHSGKCIVLKAKVISCDSSDQFVASLLIELRRFPT